MLYRPQEEEMNHFLEKILRKIVLFAVTIGITDEKKEGRWVYSNTGVCVCVCVFVKYVAY